MAAVWEVLDVLQQLAELDEDECQAAIPLCRLSLEEIQAQLRPDADPSDFRIISAAAAQAFYSLCVKRGSSSSGEITSFKAGDLSVTKGSENQEKQINYAKSIRDDAMLRLTPLLIDNGFFFSKVNI